MHPGTIDASDGLMRQFLGWLAVRPRTYQEVMDAWRTSCPRISVWEDALLEGLVAPVDEPAAAQGRVHIRLTADGLRRIDG